MDSKWVKHLIKEWDEHNVARHPHCFYLDSDWGHCPTEFDTLRDWFEFNGIEFKKEVVSIFGHNLDEANFRLQISGKESSVTNRWELSPGGLIKPPVKPQEAPQQNNSGEVDPDQYVVELILRVSNIQAAQTEAILELSTQFERMADSLNKIERTLDKRLRQQK